MLLARRGERPAPGWVTKVGHWAGLLAGPVWVFIGLHLLITAVVPLTVHGGWRGPADVIAVLSYLAGGLPLLVTTQEDMYPVVIGIKRMISGGDSVTEWNITMATAMLAMIPPALVVILMQKWFVKGLVDTEK